MKRSTFIKRLALLLSIPSVALKAAEEFDKQAADINNIQYDEGSGTLATLSNNRYRGWIQIETDGKMSFMDIGDWDMTKKQ